MTILFIVIMIEFFSTNLMAQTNHVFNSFKEIYDSRFPRFKYAYDTSSQTHDYSRNCIRCSWFWQRRPDGYISKHGHRICTYPVQMEKKRSEFKEFINKL